MRVGAGWRAFLAVPWVWAACATWIIVPLAWGAGSAFSIRGVGTGPDPARLLGLAVNSAKLACIAAFGAGALGAVQALVWARGIRPRWRAWFAAFAMVPVFVPPGIVAVVAVRLLGANGMLTRLLMPGVETFSVPEPLGGNVSALKPAPIFTIAGAAWTLAFCFAPVVFAAVAAALARMDRATEDAARIEGGAVGALRNAVLPAAAPALAASTSLVFILALVEFSVPESLRSLPVLVGEVYVQFGVHYDTQAALAAAGVLALLTCIAGASLARPIGGILPAPGQEEPDSHAVRWRELRWAVLPGWALAVLPTAAIVGVLASMMRHEDGPMAAIRETLVLAHEELAFGFALAGGAALLSLVVGVLLGRALADRRNPRGWRIALFLGFLVPGPVWGVGMATAMRIPVGAAPESLLLALDAFADSTAPLMIVWALRFSPVVALLAEHSFRGIPGSWRDVADLEGASNWAVLWRLELPAIRPTLGAAAALVFALALSDVGSAVLLLPPGTTTLAVRLMTLMHYAPKSEVAALSLLGAIPPILAAVAAVRLAGGGWLGGGGRSAG